MSDQSEALADAPLACGNAQPRVTTRSAARTSASKTLVGLPTGAFRPSFLRPVTTAGANCSSGFVPRATARWDSPLSSASLLKYDAAMMLFAAPCSQTNTICFEGLDSSPRTGNTQV